jgi:hypothetical protein
VKVQDMIRGERDLRLHGSRAAHVNFAGFFPEIGIRGIDPRAQIASRVTLSPADVP